MLNKTNIGQFLRRQKSWIKNRLPICFIILCCSSAFANDANRQQVAAFINSVQQAKLAKLKPLPAFVMQLQASKSPRPTNSASGSQHINGILSNYSIYSLSMTASLTIGKRSYALLLAPTGNIVEVKVADYIGREHAKITNISNNSLTVLLRQKKQKQQRFSKKYANLSIPLVG